MLNIMVILSKILNLIKCHQKDIFLGCCIVLIAVIGFSIGRINALRKTPVKIIGQANVYKATASIPVPDSQKSLPTRPKDLRVVASKASSTKKYHHTICSGAKRIKLENQIWFNSAKEAEKRGYVLAGNCNP